MTLDSTRGSGVNSMTGSGGLNAGQFGGADGVATAVSEDLFLTGLEALALAILGVCSRCGASVNLDPESTGRAKRARRGDEYLTLGLLHNKEARRRPMKGMCS